MSSGRGQGIGLEQADDPFELVRFVEAQRGSYGGYESAHRELEAGCKVTHWMWYIFPQLRGLGLSDNAFLYGISGLSEARAYAQHPLLGERLRECTRIIAGMRRDTTADKVFGSTDSLKLRSCMTLFELADPAESAYTRVLERYFDGMRDERTLQMLALR
jgi:uncharacterized protein (DUF1810 family)